MKSILATAIFFATSMTAPAFAQDALADAQARDACNGFEVIRARYEQDPLRLIVSCGDNPLPVLSAGGAPVAGAAAAGATATNLAFVAPIIAGVLGVAGVAAAAGGGSTTPDTQ